MTFSVTNFNARNFYATTKPTVKQRASRLSIGVVLGLTALAQSAAAVTFTTANGKLLDPCRNTTLMRGVNAGIAFPSDPTAEKLSQVAQTGANTVRLTFRWMYNRNNPQAVETALRKALENHMLAMPSVWDATGNWDKLAFAVDFWTRPEMVAVLRQYEDTIVLNIANEAGDANVSETDFVSGYQQAILKLRKAGLHMPLVIDAPNYGRDETYLLKYAKSLIYTDPDRNLLFSWHPWDIFIGPEQQTRFKTTIDTAISNNIPLILGEFSHVGANYQGEIDYSNILQYSAEKNVGWLWWWWSSGNTPDLHAMTTDGTYGNWANVGNEIVNSSPYGIAATSKHINYLDTRTCAGKPVKSAMPTAPAYVKATAVQGAEVNVTWKTRTQNVKNFDVQVFDESTGSWRLVKVVGSEFRSTHIGAGAEFVYSIDSPQDRSLDYAKTYQIRVGAYNGQDAIAYSQPVTVTTQADPRICSNGNGLEAQYYLPSDIVGDWQGLVKIDPQVNFNWGVGSPVPSDPTVPSDHFQVAWYGEIEPQFSGEYSFYTNSDDFARVWIDGVLVIDHWDIFGSSWATGKIQLTGGARHAILVEYREWDGSANIALYWASNKLKRELVPQCRLFAPTSG